MPAPRLAWAITGSGHYITECVEFLLTLDNVDLFLSQAGEEVLKMYGFSLPELKNKLPVYRDKAASAPPVGLFYSGHYHTFVMAPTTSNTVAKCVLGIADTLTTNLYAQAGKLTFDDLKQLHATSISGKPFTYTVVGSDKKIKMEDLKKYGEVRRLNLDELFGY